MTIARAFCLLFLAFCCHLLSAQQRIALYPGTPPNSKPATGLRDSTEIEPRGQDTMEWMIRVVTPSLTMYLPDKKKASGAAVIICPGGGYTGLATGHEGRSMAQRLQAAGVAAFVLRYRLPETQLVDHKEIVPLQDAQRAIQIVRENAQKWGIDPRKIGIMGSSAGTHWQKAQISNPKNTPLRPDFMILNYPVISFADSLTHYGSRENLVGAVQTRTEVVHTPISAADIQEYSNELHVGANTPPTFITSAVDDDVVNVQNSLVFIAALQKNKVPVASFFYSRGGHGYGMDNPTSDVEWMDACLVWLRERGLVKK